jgi:hypothetical protein
MGKVLKARYVAVQLAPTIRLFISNREICLGAISTAVPILPVNRSISVNTAQPLNVVRNNVGKTELSLTLAFLHKSYMLKQTLEDSIHKSQESKFIRVICRRGRRRPPIP